jgi:cytochrome b
MQMRSVSVWDLPLRAFHWLLVASFAGAWLTAEGERWRGTHYALGCTAVALIAFRIFWGFAGTRYARFSSLDFRPRSAVHYLRSLAGDSPEHHTGHNPAASWAIVAILCLVAASAASGWIAAGPGQAESIEELHGALAAVALGLVGLHILAVLASSVIHRENLVQSMVTGRKRSGPDAEPAPARAWVAALLATSLAALWSVAPWSSLATDRETGASAAQNIPDSDD